jgi:uncharacterized protein (DUF1778 family)
MAAIPETRDEKLDLRLSATTKRLLQMAAAAGHRSLSQFVLESAVLRARETLPDRQHFGLSVEKWKEFQAALDAPPRKLPRMKKLLREASVFERAK